MSRKLHGAGGPVSRRSTTCRLRLVRKSRIRLCEGRVVEERLDRFSLTASKWKWLPPRHDCCPPATPSEDLTVIPASPCARRFLATPLDEIIPRRLTANGAREGEGKSCVFRV